MESKSHFLIHFIPGMLLGSVVGLAFGSLLVASQIPQQNVGSATESNHTVQSDSGLTTAQRPLIRSIPDSNGYVGLVYPDASFTLRYKPETFQSVPTITNVSCASFSGFDEFGLEPLTKAILFEEAQMEPDPSVREVKEQNVFRMGDTKTSLVKVNGFNYFEFIIGEGAAGTAFEESHYFTKSGDFCLDISWVAAYPQCLNYDHGSGREKCISDEKIRHEEIQAVINSFEQAS